MVLNRYLTLLTCYAIGLIAFTDKGLLSVVLLRFYLFVAMALTNTLSPRLIRPTANVFFLPNALQLGTLSIFQNESKCENWATFVSLLKFIHVFLYKNKISLACYWRKLLNES